MSPWDTEVDVLVIGAGGADLAAAVAAHDAGALVAITEKLERFGGNTALSTGSLPGAGTLRTYCPEAAGFMYVGAKGSEGEAIRWGEELGARFGNMASYQGHPAP